MGANPRSFVRSGGGEPLIGVDEVVHRGGSRSTVWT
jgi:hypothetical protein